MAAVANADAERKPAAPGGRDPAPPAQAAATGTSPGSLGRLGLAAKASGNAHVGATTDPLERDADRVAGQVMRQLARTGAPEVGRTDESLDQGTAGTPGAGGPAVQGGPGPSGTPPIRRQVPAPDAQALDAVDPATAPVAERTPGPVSDRVQGLLDAGAGAGVPLPGPTRTAFESSLGRDLSMVRVHDDEKAHEAAASLGALAFTRGADIYFGAGRYDPDGPEGRRLLAHELAHVAQQGAAPVGGPIRRAADPIRRAKPTGATQPTGPKGPAWSDTAGNSIDASAKTVKLVKVRIPKVKIDTIGSPVTVRQRAARARPSTESYTTPWSSAAKNALAANLATFLQSRPGQQARGEGAQVSSYFFRHGQTAAASDSPVVPIVGREEDLKEALWRPLWEKAGGAFAQFDIDHKKDWSLGGTNDIDNLWLLERRANQRLGSLVWNPVWSALDAFVTSARPHLSGRPPTVDGVDRSYAVQIESWKASGESVPGHPSWTWDLSDMGKPALTKYLRPVTGRQRAQLTGTASSLAIYSRRFGRSVKQLPFDGPGLTQVSKWGRPKLFRVVSVQVDRVGEQVQPGAAVGTLNVEAFHDNQWVTEQTVPLPIIGMAGVLYGGFVNSDAARASFRTQFKHASPIDWDDLEFEVGSGFVARGVIRPTLPALRNAELAVILGDGITVEASLTGPSLSLPGPLTISGGMIVARIGTQERPSITGTLAMEIEDLARGSVSLGFSQDEGFSFDGRLATLPDKPYDASIEVSYRRGEWGATGRVGVGPGKITGIRRGAAVVSLAGERLSAEGEFESTFRGLSGGRLSLIRDPVTGTTIAGALTLGRLPGIEGGEVAARVQQSQGVGGWSLSGSVTARPAIPGVTGSITGRYEDGAFLAEADLGYRRGMLDGRLHLGVTNQAVSNGRPAGPPVPGPMTVWGGGSLRLQLTPWLIGTAMVEVRPNGTIAVAGRIGLPDTFTLFDRRELNRRLFSIGIDIPIVGIAVAGQRVGIFATVSGGLDLVAGIGPGQLLGTGVTVSYDPDLEDATRVEGDTQLVVPADAGMRLFVRGGVGAGIPLVSAEAGVELGAELGLAGRLTAGAHLVWTRSGGLVLDAEAGLTAQPRFRFSADLFAKVSVGIGWLSKDLYDERWRIGGFEYGSDLRFGVFLPLHAQAGHFDFSFDRMRFEYPSIDPGALAMGAIRHVVG